jgi:hypothetical protein
MWPFLLVPVALIVLVVFLRSEAGRTRRRGMWITVAVAAVLAFGGILLLGIPGAIVYGVSAPWVRLFLGDGYAELGDGAWPAAIVITLTWPWSFVIAYAIANGPLRERAKWVRVLVMILLPYAVAVLLALWAHLSAGL